VILTVTRVVGDLEERLVERLAHVELVAVRAAAQDGSDPGRSTNLRNPRAARPMPPLMQKFAPPVAFLPARAKLWIGSLDNPEIEVRAQYNPKELQIDKQVPWGDHKARSGGKTEKDRSKQSDLEFNGAPKRSMTIELLFDTYELRGKSIEPDIRRLEEMSSVVNAMAPGPELRRPHHCIVAWGDTNVGMRPFRCVIDSLVVKYTMWDHAGMPVRATCTVKLTEAHKMAGANAAEDRYGEKRRWPGGKRTDPAEYDLMTSRQYMEKVARKRYDAQTEEEKKEEGEGEEEEEAE
jgi:hypothetical protein